MMQFYLFTPGKSIHSPIFKWMAPLMLIFFLCSSLRAETPLSSAQKRCELGQENGPTMFSSSGEGFASMPWMAFFALAGNNSGESTPALKFFLVVDDATCAGLNDGTAEVIIFQGTPPYSYTWSHDNSLDTSFVDGLSPGLISVTVSDANGDVVVKSAVVKAEIELELELTSTPESCIPGGDGTVTATLSGGSEPYTYSWNTGQTGATLTNLNAGTYTVTATDANGCFLIDSVEVEPASGLDIGIITTNVNCDNSTLGSATITVLDGSPPYTYQWSTSPSDDGLFVGDLLPGTYSATVTDAAGCSVTESFTIVAEPGLDISLTGTPPTCDTCFDGSIIVNVNGGTEPFSYQWNINADSDTVTNLGPGIYCVTVTDALGCTGEDCLIFSPSTPLTADLETTDESCDGLSDGTATVTPAGGLPPYTIEWSVPGQTGTSIDGLAAGDYSVTVTDVLGTSVSIDFTINPGDLLVLIADTKNTSCNNNDGSIDLTVSDGSGNYDYDWDDDQYDGQEDLSDLPLGTYCVTVTDLTTGCTVEDCYTIEEENPLELEADVTGVSCDGGTLGSIDLTVLNGSGNYAYDWDDDQYDGQEDLSDLPLGTYCVTVTDLTTGCTISDCYTIEEENPLELEADVTGVSCDGSTLGSIDLTVLNGSGNYAYDWDDDQYDGQEDLSDLPLGTYCVTVTDLTTGCTISDCYTIEEENPLELEADVTGVSCDGGTLGSIDLTVLNGSGNYAYDWDDDQYDGQEDLSDLPLGTYCVTVTDLTTGCTVEDCYTIEEENPLELEADVTGVSCDGGTLGSIDLTVLNGSGNYAYDWDDDQYDGQEDLSDLPLGTYCVTVTDLTTGCTVEDCYTIEEENPLELEADVTGVSCDGGTLGSIDLTVLNGSGNYAYDWDDDQYDGQEDLSDLPLGTYCVTVTDLTTGCTVEDCYTIEEENPLELEADVTGVSCDGGTLGSIDLTVLNGSGNYAYDWDDDQYDGQEDLSDLPLGTYCVTVTDLTTGCTISDCYTIEEENPLELEADVTGVSCDGSTLGSIDLTVLNGSGNYAYDWDDDQYDGQEDLSDLPLGTYCVTVTDLTTGCTVEDCYTIEEENPLELEADVTGVSCDGGTLGSIDLTVLNGSGNYAYDWDDDQYDGQEDLSDLPLGTYCVTVTDLTTGCTISDCYTIEEENPLELEADVTGVSCDGGTLGSIDLTVLNGSGNYAYDWDDDQYDGQEDLSDLPLGTYCVTVTDVTTGCTISDCYTIEEENPLELEADVTGVSCDGSTLGSIDLTVLNGSGNYAYDWDDDQYDGQEDLSDLPLGTYCVTVTDLTTGCTVEDCYTIEEENPLELEADVTGVSCDGSTLGSIDLTVLNGSGNYAYDWDDDQYDGQEDLSDLPLGTYCVTVTDLTTGCTVEDCYTIEEENPLELEADVTGVSCDGGTLGSIDLTVLNGSGNYAYDWDDDQYDGQEDLSDLPLGTYCVTVTDLTTGCTVEDCYTIEEENPLELEADVTGVSCDGGTLGSIDLTVLNGSGNYAYDWDDDQYDGQEDLSDLPLGTYCVTVTDLTTGCTVEDCYTIEEENPLELEADVTGVSCDGGTLGSIDLTVLNGSGNYAYDWDDDQYDGQEDLSDLPLGTYCVTVTDLTTGCTVEDCYTIEEENPLELEADVTGVSCDGGTLGSIDLTVLNGSGNYAYDWDDDQYDGQEDLSDLPLGTYCVTVTDLTTGCTVEDCYTIEEENPLELEADVTGVSCDGTQLGSIDLTVLNGSGNYAYDWDDDQYDGQEDLSDLPLGTYCVTVTDLTTGCTVEDCYTIEEENPLETEILVTPEWCEPDSNGTITIVVSGGSGTYQYEWAPMVSDTAVADSLPVGSYMVTITDLNTSCTLVDTIEVPQANEIDISGEVTNIPCDLSALGAIDVTVTGTDPTAIYNYDWDDDQYDGLEDLTDLPEGTYILTVTDNFGCTAVDTFMVIIEGTIELDTLITNASCLGIDDGAIEVIPLTGTPPYTIEWSDPSLDGQFNPTGLSSGNYSLTVTDALGCFQSLDLFIDVEKTLELNPTITQVDCHGDSTGSIALTVTGGTEPYMYLWEADPLNDSPTLDDLPAGSYPVTVTDAEGCIAIDTFVVNENPAIEITADITNTSCPPDSNGMIVLTIEGGVSPYTVLWSMGDTTTTVDSLTTGDYTVTVTDALGCSEELTATVGADSSPLADFSWGFQTCTQDSVVIVFQDESTDPSGIVDWQWVFNETDTFLIQDPVYTVYADTNLIVELTVTSGDGCIGTKIDTVPVDLVEVFLMDTVICLGDSVGLNPMGDTSYQYLWFPGELFDDPTQVNPIVSPDSTTNYQVLITGISGDTCQIIELITVTVADLMVINLPPDTLTCEEEITLQASVQNADFFAWFNENGQIISFADTVTVTPEDTSYYIIAALDTNSCFASDTVAVIEGKTDLSLADTFVVCLGNSVTLDIVNSDPDDIYVYDWKPEDLLNMDSIPNPVFTPDSLGSYVFTATAVNQYECDWIDSTTVIVIDSSSTGDFLVFGQCEELTMNFINGNAPYYKLCYGVGDSCSTNKITSFVYPDTGTYTVMLIKTDPNIICSPDTIFKDIQVLEAPFLSLAYDWEFEECGDSALIAFFDQSIHVNDEIVRWEWVFVSDNLGDTLSTSMLQNPLVEVQESDSLYITLFVTTRVGCEGVLRDTLPIELIDVSLPDTLFICPGDTTTLGLVPGADDYTFLWTPNEFISDPTAENPEVYPPVTTTYIVEVTDLVPDTCSIERSVTVVVLPPLALSVSQDVIQCSDTLVPISASSPGAEISYEWSTSPDFDPIIGVTSEILAMPGDPIAIYYVRTTDNQTGCQALASVQVANYEVDIDLIGDTLICLDQSAIISVVPGMEGDSLGLQYEWTSTDPGFPGSSDSTISVSPANSAWYNVVASNGFCIGEDSLQLIVDTFATTAQLFLDRDTLYKGEMAILEATAIGNNISYDWTPRDGLSDPTSSITEASPEVTTEYSVLITNEDTQCATVRDTLITVLESVCGRPNIFLPNAFTPNDDNVNDVLFLRAVNVTSVYLAVYNRWGQLIFETDSLDRGWDGTFKGKELDPDVYGYYFEVDCLGGQNYFEKGNVTLIR